MQITIVGKRRATDILYPDESDGIIATTDDHMLIEQQMPTGFLLQVFQNVLVSADVILAFILTVFAIVVVAHDGIHTVAGRHLF